MHLLLFLDENNKINTLEKVDLISAEIPNEDIYPHLYDVVKQFMIHGACGEQNMGSPCMNKNTQKCSKNFPKNFNNKTSLNSSGYPLYVRRNDGKEINYKGKRSNKVAANRFVVPYNRICC